MTTTTSLKDSNLLNINRVNERYLVWTALGILTLTVLFIRFRLLSIPLERDEGDYAYHAMLLLDGVSLGDDLIRKRFFVIYLFNAIFIGLFGNTATAVHAGLLVVNLATIFLIFTFLGG